MKTLEDANLELIIGCANDIIGKIFHKLDGCLFDCSFSFDMPTKTYIAETTVARIEFKMNFDKREIYVGNQKLVPWMFPAHLAAILAEGLSVSYHFMKRDGTKERINDILLNKLTCQELLALVAEDSIRTNPLYSFFMAALNKRAESDHFLKQMKKEDPDFFRMVS